VVFEVEFFCLIGEKWQKHNLTYRIHRYSHNSSLIPAAIDEEITLAFAAWANVTNLEFRQVSGKADINISFFRGEHGDNYPFNGTGMVLAHAFPPPTALVHFDDDLKWTVRRKYGMELTVKKLVIFGLLALLWILAVRYIYIYIYVSTFEVLTAVCWGAG
jgi:hypothetical protein